MISTPTTATEPISDELGDLSASLRLSVTRLARQLRRTSSQELSPSQESVLATVTIHGPLPLGRLAEVERVAAPSVTKVVAALTDLGLVARERDPDDGRVVRVRTTEAGRAVLRRNRDERNAWLTSRLHELEPDDLQCLAAAADVLERLAGERS